MIKQLAKMSEMQNGVYIDTMNEINCLARRASLVEYTTYSRLWEYPWAWHQLKQLNQASPNTLDIGSERSPMAWFLAAHGFAVTVSDRTARYWRNWNTASQELGITVRRAILDAQRIDVPTASIDVCTSFSVFEHIPDQKTALTEMARILRPGGSLVMTLDICEPQMGMVFPEWNGDAPSMQQIDMLFQESPWFEPGFADLKWNTDDIPDFLAWHRTTAPHHTYTTCGLVIRRNSKPWLEGSRQNTIRRTRGTIRALAARSLWSLLPSPGTRPYELCCKLTGLMTKLRRLR